MCRETLILIAQKSGRYLGTVPGPGIRGTLHFPAPVHLFFSVKIVFVLIFLYHMFVILKKNIVWV